MEITEEINIEELIAFRKKLHQFPETALEEKETAQRVKEYLQQYTPDEIIENVGGYGIVAIYNGAEEGDTIMFRCELDALPIAETNTFDYKSKNEGKGHKCGHDGHMVMVSGIAHYLSKNRPKKGRVILLYQPAEETGAGAPLMLANKKFSAIKPDYIFALHNLPGFKKGQIVIKKGVFAAASKAMIVKLKGYPSHASHPENGRNPALAAAQLIQSFLAVPQMHTELHRAALITTIHINVGQRAFGTSPGYGEAMFTLRAHRDEELNILVEKTTATAKGIAQANDLEVSIEWTEEFEAVKNDNGSVDRIQNAAQKLGLEILQVNEPFPWSEDFGDFTTQFKGAMFGLGAGENHPQLHNEDYDFPDDIIPQGTAMYISILKELLY